MRFFFNEPITEENARKCLRNKSKMCENDQKDILYLPQSSKLNKNSSEFPHNDHFRGVVVRTDLFSEYRLQDSLRMCFNIVKKRERTRIESFWFWLIIYLEDHQVEHFQVKYEIFWDHLGTVKHAYHLSLRRLIGPRNTTITQLWDQFFCENQHRATLTSTCFLSSCAEQGCT